MNISPLPPEDKPAPNGQGIDPLNTAAGPAAPQAGQNDAVNLIRQKLDQLYADEPDAAAEEREAEAMPHRSKHQRFMHELAHSGKDLAAIQTEWHNYYVQLPDHEKHEVWQEFYDSSATLQAPPQAHPAEPSELAMAAHKNEVVARPRPKKARTAPRRTPAQLRATIRDKVSAGGRLGAKQHVHSLLFGLATGAVVVFIFLFGFFNEVIIAPFIQPGRASASTPLIIGDATSAPSDKPEVIIPKINVEIPVNYNETSTDEAVIENDLQDGIVHYPTTTQPGQVGNAAFFGHSSNNIFNQGKYKFAFVLLHELVPGDTFYLTNGGKVYVYKVFSKTVVDPTDVGVLDPVPGHTATATLITCDPPGTSLHRLVVVGDQISPDPSGNSQAPAAAPAAARAATSLPGNGPTLWGRFISTAAGKAIVAVAGLAGIIAVFRWVNAPERRGSK